MPYTFNPFSGNFDYYESGTTSITIGSTPIDGTDGSVLFIGGGTVQEDNANLFWDDTNNRLLIGNNTATVAKLYVYEAPTLTGAVNYAAHEPRLEPAPASNSGTSYRGISGRLVLEGGSINYTDTNYGMTFIARSNTTGTVSNLVGASSSTSISAAGTVTQLQGFSTTIGATDAGATVTTGYFFRGSSLATTGTVTNVYGLDLPDLSGATTAVAIRTQNGACIFNENGDDYDFRIEGSGDANLFFVDAGNDNVGVGTNAPEAKSKLNVVETETATASDTYMGLYTFKTYNPAADAAGTIQYSARNDLIVAAQANNIGTVGGTASVSTNNGTGTITNFRGETFLLTNNAASGTITTATGVHVSPIANNSTGTITRGNGVSVLAPTNGGGGTFTTFVGLHVEEPTAASTNYAILTDGGDIVLNEDGGDYDFRVEASGVANAFFVQGSDGFTGFNEGTPVEQLDINGRIALQQVSGSTNDGAIWHDSTQDALQGYTSGIEGTYVRALATLTEGVQVINTTSETSLVGTLVGTNTLPANFFEVGKTVRIRMSGFWNLAAGGTIRFKVKLGSTIIGDTTTVTVASTGNQGWCVEFDMTCRTTGATGTVMGQGITRAQTSGIAAAFLDMENISTDTIDTTSSQALTVTVQMGTANVTNYVNSEVFTIEELN